jgi:hypothetical protein
MSEPKSPFELEPPSLKRIGINVSLAAAAALVLLILVILPSEYGIDLTGAGEAMGLTEINGPALTIEIRDVLGGNEAYKEVAIPDFGQPIPLPNTDVFQKQSTLASADSMSITLQAFEETEIKTFLQANQVIEFSWQLDQGQVYVDFHGHDPLAGDDFWVRYEEQQAGSEGFGSLVAPFEGEHGWYFLNYNDHPVVITLNVSGYYDEIIDYGIFGGA